MLNLYPPVAAGSTWIPSLAAAVDAEYAMKVLVPAAAKGIREEGKRLERDGGGGKASEGERLACELDGVKSVSVVDRRVIAMYTDETFLYTRANWLLRELDCFGESADTESSGRRLWPFIALLQMALMRAQPKENAGGCVFRGGLISEEVIVRLRDEGPDAALMLRGFTSCSRKESTARVFAGHAKEERGLRRVLWRIALPRKQLKASERGQFLVGAAFNARHYAGKNEGEEEVLLLDSTTVRVTEIHESREGFMIRAYIDWDATWDFFGMFVD
jgi:hypothetical protein